MIYVTALPNPGKMDFSNSSSDLLILSALLEVIIGLSSNIANILSNTEGPFSASFKSYLI